LPLAVSFPCTVCLSRVSHFWGSVHGWRRLIIGCEQSALAWINSRSRRSFQTKRSGIAFLRR
jgi:hypothetical protein